MATVIVVADKTAPLSESWLKSLIASSETGAQGARRDHAASRLQAVLARLALADPRVRFLDHSDRLSDIEACNCVLSECTGDFALLAGQSMVSEGWLTELSDAALSEERTAFAWPVLE